MTPKGAIFFLEQHKPDWFVTTSFTESTLIGTAILTSEAHNPSIRVEVRISSRDGKSVQAFEQDIGKLFPAFCPERHINRDGSFCIGLNYSTMPITEKNVDDWWQVLLAFLQDQLLAERTGVWRSENSLSHGETAAHYQIRAEALAEKLFLRDEYSKAMVSRTNWLKTLIDEVSYGHRRLDNQLTQELTNQSAKFGLSDPDSKLNKKRAKKLVCMEQKRRKAEVYFWQQARNEKLKCCGKMKTCQLGTKI